MNCLHCGKPLTQMETDSGWHRRCSRSFFGTDDVPMVDVSGEALETVVTPNPAGQIRPGGWVALIRPDTRTFVSRTIRRTRGYPLRSRLAAEIAASIIEGSGGSSAARSRTRLTAAEKKARRISLR